MSANNVTSKLKDFFDKLNPIRVAAPLKPKGRFPFIDAHDVLVDVKTNEETGDEVWVRLSTKLEEIGSGGGGPGVGIADIVWEKTEESPDGDIEHYKIVLTDANVKYFSVRNGKNGKAPIKGVDYNDGAPGVGISKIELTNTEGHVDTYTITMTDGSTFGFTVKNGEGSVIIEYDSINESIIIK